MVFVPQCQVMLVRAQADAHPQSDAQLRRHGARVGGHALGRGVSARGRDGGGAVRDARLAERQERSWPRQLVELLGGLRRDLEEEVEGAQHKVQRGQARGRAAPQRRQQLRHHPALAVDGARGGHGCGEHHEQLAY